MAAVTSFHTEKCCHLVSTHKFTRRICSSVRQFLIHSTFVLVLFFLLSYIWYLIAIIICVVGEVLVHKNVYIDRIKYNVLFY